MMRDEQKFLVQQLTDGINRYIATRIDNEKIPEAWDGHELRMLVVDIAKEYIQTPSITKKQIRAYKNTRLVNCF